MCLNRKLPGMGTPVVTREVVPGGLDTLKGITVLIFSIRWYRAPELLYGARKYDEGVDLW